MAIVDAPFEYELELTRLKKRTKEEIVVWDVTPVSVGEVSKKDAPVAIRGELQREGVIEYRYLEGALWRPLMPVEGSSLKDSLETVAARANGLNPFVSRSSMLKTKPDKVEKMSDVMVKEIHKNGRANGQATAQAMADELRVIDGVVYEKTPGPVFWVVPADKTNKSAKIVLGDALEVGDDRIPSLMFRADDLAGAVQAMKKIFKAPAKPDVTEPTFLMDGVYALDEYAESVIATGRYLFTQAPKDLTLGSMSTPFLRAWHDYTDPVFDRETLSDELVALVHKGGEIGDSSKLAHLARMTGYLKTRFENEAAPAPAMG